MTTSKQTYEPETAIEKVEDEASIVALGAGEALRLVEVAGAVLVGLLLVPPLGILAVIVVVPLALAALVVGVIAAVLYVPWLLIHVLRGHRRGHRGDHRALFTDRLRHAGRALLDLAPHRVAADVRRREPSP